jgi:hypothetical protein
VRFTEFLTIYHSKNSPQISSLQKKSWGCREWSVNAIHSIPSTTKNKYIKLTNEDLKYVCCFESKLL